MTAAYVWRCVCGDTGSGEAAAQRHAAKCARFGWPNTNPYITEYNAGVRKAVNANAADRLHADGLCTSCGVKPRTPTTRTCSGCRQRNRKKKP